MHRGHFIWLYALILQLKYLYNTVKFCVKIVNMVKRKTVVPPFD